ncbi:MAG: hypothetical protein ACI8RZ_007925, partial [Myxococcota bacterium]
PAVIAMSEGRFADEDLKGVLAMPLYEALLEVAEANKMLGESSSDYDGDAFRGELVIAVDRRVPWSTLRSVMYSSGQAQFSAFSLLVVGGEAVEYGMTALLDEPTVTIQPERLLVSWFGSESAVEIPCAWGCREALSVLLGRMRWHQPRHHGGAVFADDDTPLSRIFDAHRLLAEDTALLSVLGISSASAVKLTTPTALLSEGEPVHALMEANRETAERLRVGPIRIESTTPTVWRRRLEQIPARFKMMAPGGAEATSPGPALGVNDIRACLLPALIAEPERSGGLEVTVRMTGEAIYAVHTPWQPVSACLSRRLVGRSLRQSSWGGFFGTIPTVNTSRATARITVTIAEAP